RLLALAPTDELRARAMLGLARAFEAQKFWVPARDVYAQALARFPDVKVGADDLEPGGRLGSLVAQRLGEPPYDKLSADRAEPAVPAPLVRPGRKPLARPVRPPAAAGVAPSPDSSRIFLAQGRTIRPASVAPGESSWSAELGGPAVWVGYLEDHVLAATDA